MDKCPKCGKEIIGKSHFSEPDHTGVQAMLIHSYKMVKNLMGGEHKQSNEVCFITQNEWKELYE